ncbi:energy transducer TonB [Chitinimonas arctica]|uniref:Energy transducer TonB n=1 Tax=Chitinimonas arctica TaxID=2594795 RepID=A0A516SKG6_9NEIS|nr:energy transducer TonB [Chitinimonas arctica]QDQ28518.1 energy transducer TonB [Chitinimonas arctica]
MMDFAREADKPFKRFSGLLIAVLIHAAAIHALFNGLAKRAAEVLLLPIETRIIEAPKPPPPPVEEILLPTPALRTPPPPAYVPPPEIRANPPPVTTAITTVTTVKPDTPAPPPAPPAPPAPVVVAAPVAPVVPVSTKVGVVCSNFDAIKVGLGDKFSTLADEEGIQTAEVTVLLNLAADGQVESVTIKASTHPAAASLARGAARRLQCIGQGRPIQLLVPFSFRLQD